MTGSGSAARLDRTVARVLQVGIYLGIGLLAVGVALMVVNGVDPMGPAPAPFSLASLAEAIRSLDPLAFLWTGLIVAIATPVLRVVASLIGFERTGQRRMVLISIAILVVLAVSVLVSSVAA